MRSLVGVNVSRETLGRLEIYTDLVELWNPRINLISKRSLPEIWLRHIADSAQILGLAQGRPVSWTDLGSGGGFPGAVVAILAAELNPEMMVRLVESDQRKAVFLRSLSRETGVVFEVLSERIESLEPLHSGVVSARALADLTTLLKYANKHLLKDGTALFMKGATAREEIAGALEKWRFRCEQFPSRTGKEAVILRIGEIERV